MDKKESMPSNPFTLLLSYCLFIYLFFIFGFIIVGLFLIFVFFICHLILFQNYLGGAGGLTFSGLV